MRGFRFMPIIAAAMAPAMASIPAQPIILVDQAPLPTRPDRRRVSAQASVRYRRSRGAQAKRRRHVNRLHVARRVRRRHRRARAA